MSAFVNANSLVAVLHDVRAEGPPARRLICEMEMRNNTETPIVVLRSDVRVTLNNIEIARGDLLRVRFPLVRPAVVSGAFVNASLEIPLTREGLAAVEERRAGDVEQRISAYLDVSPVVGESDAPTLGLPTGANLEIRFGSIRDRIPQSRWLELLRTWGWDETLLIELPFRLAGRAHPVAVQRWEEAVEHYRSGKWDDTLTSCRRVIEMLAAEKTPDGAPRADLKRLREYFDSSQKGDILNLLLKQLSDFLHLGRHQQMLTAGIRVDREDAMLALSSTAAFLRYVNR